eukprot:TRINITY_DN4728_c0_g1_i5.p1 TRINITY_DN4728_c0_g1~~TRINITY_DN4728_c0_g1_i5.p1  ORF type:complete len:252 (+),score=35.12 TRINITY_DN4728_c0_g1_i5:95-757(+)
MAYCQWTTGSPLLGSHTAQQRVVVCVHGLTRNNRDFDFLAQTIVKASSNLSRSDPQVIWTVYSVDVVGRGKSDWLEDKTKYAYSTYTKDLAAFLEHVTTSHNVAKVDYIGTSMGGIIGMCLFFAGAGKYINTLTLNDIGALVPAVGLARMADYVGKDPRFQEFDIAEAYFRKIFQPFGPLTSEQWKHITMYSIVPDTATDKHKGIARTLSSSCPHNHPCT